MFYKNGAQTGARFESFAPIVLWPLSVTMVYVPPHVCLWIAASTVELLLTLERSQSILDQGLKIKSIRTMYPNRPVVLHVCSAHEVS